MSKDKLYMFYCIENRISLAAATSLQGKVGRYFVSRKKPWTSVGSHVTSPTISEDQLAASQNNSQSSATKLTWKRQLEVSWFEVFFRAEQ